jgi:hypothetical protein
MEVARPTNLVVFDGARYRTEAAWCAAFAEFKAAREAWAEEHGGAALGPYEVTRHCPVDPARFRKSGS